MGKDLIKMSLIEDLQKHVNNDNIYYIEELAKHISVDEQQFRKHYQGFVFIRIIQTLGAYGFRGLIQKKEHFIKSIPQALTNLKNELPIINAIVPMPYLLTLIDQLPELTEF